jgi:hypothetical protein
MNLSDQTKNVIGRIKQLGFTGERKAVALLCLGFYTNLFALIGLVMLSQVPEWAPCFLALAVCYAVGFFALAADWFWGRWFAYGLGSSGVTMAIMSLIATRQVLMPLVVFAVMHAVLALALMGEKMAAVYEAQEAWRKRWNVDEEGVLRVRRTVTRAATSLPGLIMFALAPREGVEMASLALLGLGAAGLLGVLRNRTWGVMMLGAGAALAVLRVGAGAVPMATAEWSGFGTPMVAAPQLVLGLSALLLVAAVQPFARPMLVHLLRRR